MSTICSLPNGKLFVAVKGAPETIKGMLSDIPEFFDDTYKRFTRQGSRVLALGYRELDNMPSDKVS
jgi:manganese-transporting P-type ATPase